jgi:hypothetical protein
MLMLTLQVVLVALVANAIVCGILLNRRLAKIEHDIESQATQTLGVLGEVEDLSSLTRSHGKEINTLQEIARLARIGSNRAAH